jgi:hypothetical protein
MYRSPAILSLFVAAAVACERGGPEPDAAVGEVEQAPSPDAALEAAREAADALTAELREILFAVMEAEGPVAALDVCADSAQMLTRRHERPGFSLRRVSLRVRNTANAPDAWESTRLEALEEMHHDGALPGEVVGTETEGGETVIRYMRPIVAAAPCLVCHGPADRIDPALYARIRERYPDDQATGYAAGDLRGAVSIRATVSPIQ